MKTFKKIFFSLIIASAAGSFSSVALAELDGGRPAYAPADAIDLVAGKTKIALDALMGGTEPDKVAALINDALAASKEVNANDKIDRERSRANNKLKAARNFLKNNSPQEAEQQLHEAYKGYLSLKGLL